jgi:hypothetical protein
MRERRRGGALVVYCVQAAWLLGAGSSVFALVGLGGGLKRVLYGWPLRQRKS